MEENKQRNEDWKSCKGRQVGLNNDALWHAGRRKEEREEGPGEEEEEDSDPELETLPGQCKFKLCQCLCCFVYFSTVPTPLVYREPRVPRGHHTHTVSPTSVAVHAGSSLPYYPRFRVAWADPPRAVRFQLPGNG